MRYTQQQKIFIVNKIKERKETLFGAYSNTITHDSKLEQWEIIYKDCLANGIILPSGKDASFIRDTIWPNMKGTTLVSLKTCTNLQY